MSAKITFGAWAILRHVPEEGHVDHIVRDFQHALFQNKEKAVEWLGDEGLSRPYSVRVTYEIYAIPPKKLEDVSEMSTGPS